MRNEVLIVIPTFNEKENIAKLIKKIRDFKIDADILVVDDNSPDGTGKIADQISKSDKGVFILHRKEKTGLGRAYVAGFKWGIENGYKKLISMDADFSHPVEALEKLINLCNSKTVVIGSRYTKGGKITGWKWPRYVNSWGANLVTRTLLQIKAKDATAGFKCYPVEFLKAINLDKIQASGYAFQVEMPLLAQDNGFRLVETPITFADRISGESKISGELMKSAKIVFKLAAGKKSYRQFVKFAIVGAINTVVDWAIFYPISIVWLKSPGTLSAQSIKQISKAISFIFAAASSYFMNRAWTFRSKDKAIAKQAGKFFVVALGGLIINQIAFYGATAILNWRSIFGLIAATAAATLWNFFLNKVWTFKN
ncbi:MAG: glycosyltransferase family 2 protein [Candidatus Berkelbacteria bacterium]|nr:glycosyltransferase family 2 protein [Candidatus Berkelbacteria bacterium]